MHLISGTCKETICYLHALFIPNLSQTNWTLQLKINLHLNSMVNVKKLSQKRYLFGQHLKNISA